MWCKQQMTESQCGCCIRQSSKCIPRLSFSSLITRWVNESGWTLLHTDKSFPVSQQSIAAETSVSSHVTSLLISDTKTLNFLALKRNTVSLMNELCLCVEPAKMSMCILADCHLTASDVESLDWDAWKILSLSTMTPHGPEMGLQLCISLVFWSPHTEPQSDFFYPFVFPRHRWSSVTHFYAVFFEVLQIAENELELVVDDGRFVRWMFYFKVISVIRHCEVVVEFLHKETFLHLVERKFFGMISFSD